MCQLVKVQWIRKVLILYFYLDQMIRAITATFAITLNGKFLLLQLIYQGKTNQSLPKFKFPDAFSLSVNEKHFNNRIEAMKYLQVIIPYVKEERKKTTRALVIFDVFRGQTEGETMGWCPI